MTTFTLRWRRRDAITWLEWDGPGLRAVFPTRLGGVSAAPYESLDLGLAVGDEPALVLENRRRLAAAIGLPLERWVVPAQVHGTRLAVVTQADAGRGARSLDDTVEDTDALLTEAAELGLTISHADCVPVVIAGGGDRGPLVVTVHAGWRGMLAGVVGAAAAALAHRGRLLGAVVGPSIGPCCFRVDDGLRERFAARFPGSADEGTVDLWACARQELTAAGVPPAAVSVAALCTGHDTRFYSHRREQGLTGRHLAVAWRRRT